MRNVSGHQCKVKMSGSENKSEQEHAHTTISPKNMYLRLSFWKFHVVVMQNSNSKEMYKKVCCTCKVAFLLIRPVVIFSPFSLPSLLSITRFYILFEQTLNIMRALLLALAKSIHYINVNKPNFYAVSKQCALKIIFINLSLHGFTIAGNRLTSMFSSIWQATVICIRVKL